MTDYTLSISSALNVPRKYSLLTLNYHKKHHTLLVATDNSDALPVSSNDVAFTAEIGGNRLCNITPTHVSVVCKPITLTPTQHEGFTLSVKIDAIPVDFNFVGAVVLNAGEYGINVGGLVIDLPIDARKLYLRKNQTFAWSKKDRVEIKLIGKTHDQNLLVVSILGAVLREGVDFPTGATGDEIAYAIAQRYAVDSAWQNSIPWVSSISVDSTGRLIIEQEHGRNVSLSLDGDDGVSYVIDTVELEKDFRQALISEAEKSLNEMLLAKLALDNAQQQLNRCKMLIAKKRVIRDMMSVSVSDVEVETHCVDFTTYLSGAQTAIYINDDPDQVYIHAATWTSRMLAQSFGHYVDRSKEVDDQIALLNSRIAEFNRLIEQSNARIAQLQQEEAALRVEITELQNELEGLMIDYTNTGSPAILKSALLLQKTVLIKLDALHQNAQSQQKERLKIKGFEQSKTRLQNKIPPLESKKSIPNGELWSGNYPQAVEPTLNAGPSGTVYNLCLYAAISRNKPKYRAAEIVGWQDYFEWNPGLNDYVQRSNAHLDLVPAYSHVKGLRTGKAFNINKTSHLSNVRVVLGLFVSQLNSDYLMVGDTVLVGFFESWSRPLVIGILNRVDRPPPQPPGEIDPYYHWGTFTKRQRGKDGPVEDVYIWQQRLWYPQLIYVDGIPTWDWDYSSPEVRWWPGNVPVYTWEEFYETESGNYEMIYRSDSWIVESGFAPVHPVFTVQFDRYRYYR